jgi:short-subunit dehydrogenase
LLEALSFVADLNNERDLAKVETKLKDDLSITMLVNNAGFASVECHRPRSPHLRRRSCLR